MIKLIVVCALVASTFADIRHIYRTNRATATLLPKPPRPPPAAVSGSPPVPAGGPKGQPIAILRQESDIQPEGSYRWAYETENGISAEEQGDITILGPEEADKTAHGSFSWTSPEGEHISITYIADENGYQPEGSHLPVAPPIPEAIQRALDWNAAHPESDESGGGRTVSAVAGSQLINLGRR